ncbi:MAG: HTH domain-containing protein [Halomonas sp.]|uniref:HTH domain-containing protein n=1 Tax=Halomonas sp. TaxID=1486246 RepID=UPI00287095C4|nr:HTH domain-containing protein [Halomonas sp.]MDR9439097.1 HTH domain-containing protein [Halomonas sp.]
MSRTTRLPDLRRVLRYHTGPIDVPEPAEWLGITLRTLYQDIAALRAMGGEVVNAPGQGNVLPPEVAPPPTARGDYYRWLFFAAGPLVAYGKGLRERSTHQRCEAYIERALSPHA